MCQTQFSAPPFSLGYCSSFNLKPCETNQTSTGICVSNSGPLPRKRIKTQPPSLHPKLAKVPRERRDTHQCKVHILFCLESWLLQSFLLQQVSDTLEKYFCFLFKNSNQFQQKLWAATSYSILPRSRSLVYFSIEMFVMSNNLRKQSSLSLYLSWEKLYNNSQNV